MGNIETDTVVARGVWCLNCDVFEDFEFGDHIKNGRCESCGCSESRHIDVKVVTTESKETEEE